MGDLTQTKVNYVRTVADVEEFLRWMGQTRTWLACDTETPGFNWWENRRMRLGQIGDADTAWCFDWDLWAGAMLEGLKGYRGPIAFHNAKFDLHWLERHGYRPAWSQVHDTQIMVSLVDGGRPSALKVAAGFWVDPRAASSQSALKDAFIKMGWGWDTVPVDFPLYWGYGGLDTILTARMAEALWPIVSTKYADLYELERASMAVLYDMEKRGTRVDPEYTIATRDRLQIECDQLRSWAEVQHDGLSLGSPQQLAGRLIHQGAELTAKTASGNWSTSKAVLSLLGIDDTPLGALARSALRYRKASKTISSYLNNFMTLKDENDRLHPSIRVLGAKTGRMSVATPSFQNLTRGPEVRDCIIPSDGHLLLLADFDQIEARGLYHYSRDPALYAALMSEDLHTTVAKLIYQDDAIDKEDPRRQVAKSSGYAKVYGAGVEQFAATAGVPVEEARRFLALYDLTFPGVPNFIGHVQAVARQRLRDDGEAWAMTAAGRRQVAEPTKLYALVNYLIQGWAADVMKRQTVELAQAGLDEFMILPVHDEIVFDVPAEMVPDVKAEVERTMPVLDTRFGVPLTIGTTVVDRWGAKYRKQGMVVDEAASPEEIMEEEDA